MSQHGCPERLSNRSKGFQEDGSSQPTMEVLVETLTGTAFEMTVSPSDTIFAIKSKIFRVEGIPVSQQHLLYNLKELEDASSLRSLGIADGARLRLVLGLRGGPISTRRLPPPPPDAPFRDLERLMDSTRDEASSPGGGCKVTVLVFRDGERVNMLRVRENDDGTYSPIDHTKYSSPLGRVSESSPVPPDDASTAVAENALTCGKMLELRRRMDSLSVQRGRIHTGEKCERIQKTRSEESLAGRAAAAAAETAPPYAEEGAFAPLYDFNYQYDYDCAFSDRYTLLPPIGSPAEVDRQPPPGALGGVGAVGPVGGPPRVLLRRADSTLPAAPRADTDTAEYGPLLVDSAPRWRSFGSSSPLPLPLPPRAAPPLAPLGLGPVGALGAPHSASSLQLRALPRPAPAPPLSSSTSDLETLKRNRVLPALSRHRNREQLHLSDEGPLMSLGLEAGSPRARPLDLRADSPTAQLQPQEPEPKPEVKEAKKIRIRCGFCKKKLTIATVHRCRCGNQYCAPHRYAEVHGCAYDYKAHAHQYLQRANPLVSAPKLPKI